MKEIDARYYGNTNNVEGGPNEDGTYTADVEFSFVSHDGWDLYLYATDADGQPVRSKRWTPAS